MRKSADLRKAQIVAVILDLADRIGPDRVTTGAIAAEVGVTQAAIFRHFPTKAEMWVAVADHVAGLLTAAWAEALEEAKPPVERLKALVGAQLDQITARPAMPMLLFSRELNVENAALRAAFRDRLAMLHGLLMREVGECQRDNTFIKDVAATDVAVLLTSIIQGVAIRWSLGTRDFVLRDEGLRLLAVQLRLLSVGED
jgi:TetR/AcrR family transcriptional regulator